jgi:hypothetical protein
MEALTALGLAANIAQFIAIAGKAVEKTNELASSHKDLLEENAELQLIASNFQGLLPKLREDCGIKEGDNGEDEVKELVKGVIGTRLKELVEAANDICVEIIQKLENIKRRRAKEEPLKSLYATWKEMRMKENFESLSVRLTNLRNQICLHINILLM